MTDANVIAVCQHPDGPGEYVPHMSPTCFMDCDCTPRVYVAVDALSSEASQEAVMEVVAAAFGACSGLTADWCIRAAISVVTGEA